MSDDLPLGAPVALALPRPRPARRPLQGGWGRLVPTVPDHARDLHDAFAADTAGRDWAYLPYGPFRDEMRFADWLIRTCLDDDPLFFTLQDPEGKPLGLASYLRIDPGNAVIEIGHIHFAPALQRTPLATEAMALMIGHAFDDLGYRRVEWKCDALNARSRRAAERLGFTYEGTFRQAAVVKGRNRDTAWYAMLDGDWPDARARFAAWLAPDNFEPDGVQRTALR